MSSNLTIIGQGAQIQSATHTAKRGHDIVAFMTPHLIGQVQLPLSCLKPHALQCPLNHEWIDKTGFEHIGDFEDLLNSHTQHAIDVIVMPKDPATPPFEIDPASPPNQTYMGRYLFHIISGNHRTHFLLLLIARKELAHVDSIQQLLDDEQKLESLKNDPRATWLANIYNNGMFYISSHRVTSPM